MADGMSGLSLSEMGISTVKKSAKVVQKAANPFAQAVKQQVTGSTPQGQANNPSEEGAMSQKPQQASAQPPSEGTVFDFFAQTKQQVSGGGNTKPTASASQQIFGQTKPQQKTQQGGTIFTPSQTPTKAPDESGSMDGNFDLNSMLNEKNPFGPQVKAPVQQTQRPQISEAEKAQKQTEEKQQLETLRKQLFDAYKQEFIEESEGKKGKKEETVQEKLQREEQEEEDKAAKKQQEEDKMIVRTPTASSSNMPGIPGVRKAKSAIMNLLKPKQGSKEGRSSKG